MIRYYSRYLDDRARQQRWIDPRLYQVRVADIEAYLVSKGWKQVTPDRPDVLVFQEPVLVDGDQLYQFVPDTEARRDYPARVYELLAGVAEVEDRYAGDVLTDILRLRTAEAGTAEWPDRADEDRTCTQVTCRDPWANASSKG